MPEEHYLGNPLLKKANTQIEFTEEQIVEFAKCAQDPVYFAKNYMQIVTLDHGLQPFDMYPFQEKMLKSFHENRFNICKLPRQPLADDTIIPTPDGKKKIKQIKVGDFVYDSSGIPIKVIDKKSYGKTEACYELNFSGSDFIESIICDKDHLWGVYIDGEYVILSAEQIYNKKENNIIVKRKGSNNIIKNWEEDIVLSSIEKVSPTRVSCIEVDNRDHMFLCGENFIPTHNSGKSTTVVSYLLHYAIFNDNVNIAILANKAQTARDLLGRLQTGYENLPKWLQQGICSWNKGSLELENGSKIFAASTSASSVRGSTYNIIFLDEFAFVPNQVADSFFSSVYPTITSGKSSKVIVVSTPKGLNHFYKLWDDAVKGKNEYVPIEVFWTDVPGRDEEFKKTTSANTSESQWRQEFQSVLPDTLINIKRYGRIEETTIGNLYNELSQQGTA